MLKKIKSLFARKNKTNTVENDWNTPNYTPSYTRGFAAAEIANREDAALNREVQNDFRAAGGFGVANRNMLNTW